MFHTLLGRLLALTLMSVGIALIGIPAANAVVPNGTASVGSVTCNNQQGGLVVTLVADPSIETEFMILVNGVSDGADLSIIVPAGQTQSVPVSNLDDGNNSIEVIVRGTEGEDGKTVFADYRINVACDAAPTGPYQNPKGSVTTPCGANGVNVVASNYPIANDFADLRPVTFTLTFVKNDSSTVTTLATVTLPSGEDDSFDFTHFYPLGESGVVSLYAEGMTPIHQYYSTGCTVVPDVIKHHTKKHPHHKKHHKPRHQTVVTTVLPNTGG